VSSIVADGKGNAPGCNEIPQSEKFPANLRIGRLAARFNIHRTTVLAHLERNGVPRRRSGPKLSNEDVHEAAILYRDGLSLKAIGVRFLVAPDTIEKALRRVGVKVRPRRGRAST
jgi:DNA-binding CsgD family transcriptional regulator